MATTMTPPPLVTDPVTLMPKKGSRARPLFDPPIVKRALTDSFRFLSINSGISMKKSRVSKTSLSPRNSAFLFH